ncbi:hypothetical protein K1719_040406 [Acacia pycnantha]|nr:hypothetical protein K1719_040406 [Acacia pycnantha]
MDSLTTLIADNTAITQVPISLVRSKSIGYISICGYQGLARHVFPSLIWSRMSPTNNPLSLVPTYAIMPSSISSSDILNCTIPGPSTIYDNLPKPENLPSECISENDGVAEVNEGDVKVLDSLCASSCRDLTTTPNTSKSLGIESSLLVDNNHSQVGTSRQDKCLRQLLINIGNNDQVTSSLSECILQGLIPRDHGDECILPGDNCPYWQSFMGERASVKFKVPRVSGCDLKGMIICCVYFPSGNLGNKACESCISIMIINYTKAVTQHYRQDSPTSFEEAEWKEILSNLDLDDQVEVIVVFGNGFTMKRTVVYLKYHESFDEHMEDPSSPSREMQREDKNRNSELSESKHQEVEVVQPQNPGKWCSWIGQKMIKFLSVIFVSVLLSFLVYNVS